MAGTNENEKKKNILMVEARVAERLTPRTPDLEVRGSSLARPRCFLSEETFLQFVYLHPGVQISSLAGLQNSNLMVPLWVTALLFSGYVPLLTLFVYCFSQPVAIQSRGVFQELQDRPTYWVPATCRWELYL